MPEYLPRFKRIIVNYNNFYVRKFANGFPKKNQCRTPDNSVIWIIQERTAKQGIGGFMLTSLFTFLLICIRLCAQKKTC